MLRFEASMIAPYDSVWLECALRPVRSLSTPSLILRLVFFLDLIKISIPPRIRLKIRLRSSGGSRSRGDWRLFDSELMIC